MLRYSVSIADYWLKLIKGNEPFNMRNEILIE